MEITELLRNQMQEALGPVNKWYCSQHYGYDVADPEILLAYYIKHGGAQHYREKTVGSARGEGSWMRCPV